MRKWLGTVCVTLGVICLLGAIGFVVYNRWEDDHAAQMTQTLLSDVQLAMRDETPTHTPADTTQSGHWEAGSGTMATIQVDGYACIGILSIPALELELPVLENWSYTKLKQAPCRYYGSYYESDFVIAAHNYQAHFGRLSALQNGDIIIFTDVTGVAYYYEVVLLETLPKEATEEMITSGFDLSLYTCTPGGANRVTVRCNTVTP